MKSLLIIKIRFNFLILRHIFDNKNRSSGKNHKISEYKLRFFFIQSITLMKVILFLLCIIFTVFCDEAHLYFFKDGTYKMNNEAISKVDGPFYAILLNVANVTTIAGMQISTISPFSFDGKITNVIRTGDHVEIDSECYEGEYKGKKYQLTGKIKIIAHADWSEATYQGKCENAANKLTWEIHADGKQSKCDFYPAQEAANRAAVLVGQNGETFQAVNVLNYPIFGYPYVSHVKDCSWFLKKFKTVTQAKPGYVIVGTDGAHCAIIDKDGDKFIQSNPVKKEVTLTPLILASTFFPKGYVIKEYIC